MKNLNQLMKQAQQLQSKMNEMQEKLNTLEVQGLSGAGMVKITLNGKNELKVVKIDPQLMNPKEIEVLEDLIIAAFNDAKTKLDAQISSEMGQLSGGLQLPGSFKFPF